jgi:O-antigen ligase
LYALRIRSVWAFVRRQPASFWLVCLFLFLEYVRPQQIWTTIQGPPYSKIVLGLAVAAFFMEGRRVRLEMPELFLGIFLAVVLASSVTAIFPEASFAEIYVFLSWVLVYVLISNSADSEGRFLVFVLTFIVYSFKMSQHGTRAWASAGFAFRDEGVNGAPGWFNNSGEFGIQMCVFVPVTAYFIRGLARHWPRWQKYLFWGIAGTGVTSIVASSSRGALLGLAAVVFWMLIKSRYKIKALVGTAVLAGVVYWLLPQQQLARLQSMGDDNTSVSRTTLWQHGREIIASHPALGIGYNNWSPYSAVHYGAGLLPHNIFIQAGAELGVTGLVAFIALIVVTLVINRRTRAVMKGQGESGRFMFEMAHGLDAALIGFLVSGFFVTVLFYPFFWINLAMSVALHNAALAASSSTGPNSSRGRPPIRNRAMTQPVRGPRMPARRLG